MSSYPPAPWTLSGEAIVSAQLLPISKVRARIPSALRIVPALPGRTLGVIALIRYGEGSSLQYHELIVAPAIVSMRARVGSWISDIFVDNEASRLGGRELWNLPKQLAHFSWRSGRHASADAPGVSIEATIHAKSSLTLPLPFIAPAFGTLEWPARWFAARGHARIGRARGLMRVNSSELLSMGFGESMHLHWIKHFRASIDQGRAMTARH